jgi:hypothetical protein
MGGGGDSSYAFELTLLEGSKLNIFKGTADIH